MATVESVQIVKVSELRQHPKNPRVALRDDVVDAIVADLSERGSMEARHAITARPVDGGFEIISGHHRHAAAVKAGLSTVPAWVVEMDDDTAYMALATSNNHGELAPLEIGLHALECVGRATAGRGKKGGLAEHASKIGKSKQYLSQLVAAAEVAKSSSRLDDLLDKAQHLHAIHAEGRRELWPTLVASLLSRGWSVADTEHWVSKVRDFDVPGRCDEWLPLVSVVERFLATREFSASTVSRLVAERDAIIGLIEVSRKKIEEADQDPEGWVDAAEAWLVAGSGGESWDVRNLVAYRLELEQRINACGPDQWLSGDWRTHVGSIKDGSISVLLTDPPYGMDYQSDFRLDRTKPKKHERIENDAAGAGSAEVAECLKAFAPKLSDDSHVFIFTNWRNEEAMRQAIFGAGLAVRGSLVWVKNNTGMGDPKTTFAPKHERIIHAVKGSPILFEREADVLEFNRVATERHPTEKPVDLLTRLIEITSVKGQRVADPFGGVASTCEAAKSIGRHFWGCEIKEEYWRAGCERLTIVDAET